MLRIAICDDEQEMVSSHKKVIEEVLRECNEMGEIVTYTVSDNLLCDVTEDQFYYDLILLDIEMPGHDGMEMAGKLKPYLPNVKIILRDAVRLITLEGGKFYTIQSGSRMEKIPYKDIMYIQREGKNAEIYDGNEIKKVRRSLQQIFDELSSEEFIFTDRGCIVNIIHVMQVKDGEAIMKNGDHLPISRSHLQEVKLKINSYWGTHIG